MQLRVIFSYVLILSGLAHSLVKAEVAQVKDEAVQMDANTACELTSGETNVEQTTDTDADDSAEACTADTGNADEDDGYADEACQMDDGSDDSK